MCVIIHKPKGVKLKTKLLKKAWEYNPDGSGFAVRSGKDSFTVKKGFMDFNLFIKAYHNATDQGQEAIMHFRIATHGTVIPSNCHPFYNGDQSLIMFHNGQVHAYGSTDLSDTKDLFKSIIVNIPPKARHKVLSSYSGSNKFVLIENGNVSRFGKWENSNGCMWSNLNHDRSATYYSYPSAKNYPLSCNDDDMDDLYWNHRDQGKFPLRSSSSATNRAIIDGIMGRAEATNLEDDEDLTDEYDALEYGEVAKCESCEEDFEMWADGGSMWQGMCLCDDCMALMHEDDLSMDDK